MASAISRSQSQSPHAAINVRLEKNRKIDDQRIDSDVFESISTSHNPMRKAVSTSKLASPKRARKNAEELSDGDSPARHRLVTQLATGGSAMAVWLARDPQGRDCVAKLLPRGKAQSFELTIANELRDHAHEHGNALPAALSCLPQMVVAVKLKGESRHALVMPFAQGTTIEKLDVNEVSTHEKLSILASVSDGLGFMHSASTSHGDVNAANVIVDVDELHKCKAAACLIDFELSRFSPAPGHADAPVGGVDRYLPPPHCAAQFDHIARDIYGVGMLAQDLFPNGDMPNEVRDMLEGCLTPDRQPSLKVVRDSLLKLSGSTLLDNVIVHATTSKNFVACDDADETWMF